MFTISEITTDQHVYNPTIQSLVAACADDWGDPETNLADLVAYGIDLIDQATYGIDVVSGELVVIQGREKGRKTTTLANILINIQQDVMSRRKAKVAIDTLEPGMRPKKYRDHLLSNLATRYMFLLGHSFDGRCTRCGGSECTQLELSPKFLKYRNRSSDQFEAIEFAMDSTNDWNLLIHGPSLLEGDTRNLDEALKKGGRWERLIDEYGVNLFAVDNLQQFMWSDMPTDYEKQVRSIGKLGSFVAQHSVACLLLAQVSLTSFREVKAGTSNTLFAAGGAKAAQEANTVFTTVWMPENNMLGIKIEEARESAGFTVYQRIEPTSGAFYGSAFLATDGEQQG